MKIDVAVLGSRGRPGLSWPSWAPVAVLGSRGRPGLSWPSWNFIQLLSFADKRVLLLFLTSSRVASFYCRTKPTQRPV